MPHEGRAVLFEIAQQGLGSTSGLGKGIGSLGMLAERAFGVLGVVLQSVTAGPDHERLVDGLLARGEEPGIGGQV